MIIKRQIELGRNQKTRDTRRIEQILSKKKRNSVCLNFGLRNDATRMG